MSKIGLHGPGNDYKHQIIISSIIYELMKKFVETKTYKNYVVLPELSLKPDSTQIPDIAVWKTIRGIPKESVLLIEICRTNKIKEDAKKLSDLMDKIISAQEAFIIDKDTLEINKISRTKANKPSSFKKDSKCTTFKLDFSKVLQKLPKAS